MFKGRQRDVSKTTKAYEKDLLQLQGGKSEGTWRKLFRNLFRGLVVYEQCQWEIPFVVEKLEELIEFFKQFLECYPDRAISPCSLKFSAPLRFWI